MLDGGLAQPSFLREEHRLLGQGARKAAKDAKGE